MELTGGLYFVEGHNKPNEHGSLSKRYYFGGEEGVRKQFYPNKWFSLADYVPNEDITEKLLAAKLAEHNQFNRALLPTALSPAAKYWRKTKEALPDPPCQVLPLDIECLWSDLNFPRTIEETTLEEIGETVLGRVFPNNPHLGFVIRYSSSARIRSEEPECRVRIYILLDRPIAEQERIERFAGLPLVDAAVFEKNTLDLITPGLVMDRAVPTWHIPHQSIFYREGERLKIDDFPRRYKRTASGNGKTPGAPTALGAYHKLIAEWEEQYQVKLKRNSPELYNAIATMASQGKLERKRFSVHFWLMHECFREFGTCYHAMEFISNNENVLGKSRGIKELVALDQTVSKYFRSKWNGTPIASIFDDKEKVKLNSLDVPTNTKQLAEYFKEKIDPFDENTEGNVIVDYQGVGLGKTSGTMSHFCELYGDDRISVCYRQSILSMHCKDLGFTYYLDVPEYIIKEKGTEWAESLSDQYIKQNYLKLYNKPAITLQSIQYLQSQMQGAYEKPGLLLLDEPERVLNELWIKPQLAHEPETVMGINERYRLFMQLAHGAHTVLIADADASAEITGWLVETLAKTGRNKYIIENEQDWYSRKVFCRFPTNAAWLAALKKLVDAGDRVLVHTDLGDDTEEFSALCEAIRQHCGLKHSQITGYCSGSVGDAEVKRDMNAVMREDRAYGNRVVVISPIIQIGTNHTGEPFDRVMLYFHHGRTIANDTFQTALRDRKAWWIGFFYKGTIAPTKHDTTSAAFAAESDFQPAYLDDDFAELQRRLARRHINAKENPAAALELLIEERCGIDNLVRFDYPITSAEQIMAKNALKAATSESSGEYIEKLKAKIGFLKEFVALHKAEDGWIAPDIIEDLQDVSDEDLEKIHKYMKQGKRDLAASILQLWNLDREIARETAKGERLAWRMLQAELLDRVKATLQSYFKPGIEPLSIIQKQERGFMFLVEGEPIVDDFNTWVKSNADKLDLAALLEIKGWKSSPHIIYKAAFDYLGCDVEVLEKVGGKSDTGQKIASKVQNDLYKEYVNNKRIKRAKYKKEKIARMLEKIRKKLAAGLELTELEWLFFRSLGRVMIVKPRAYTHIDTWRGIARIVRNPHLKEWEEVELASLVAARASFSDTENFYLGEDKNTEKLSWEG